MGKEAEDLSGKRFGDLIVLRRSKRLGKIGFGHHAEWLCRCMCGKTVLVQGTFLRRNIVTSCGCARVRLAQERREKLKGRRFGKLILISFFFEKSRVKWRCKCDCGKNHCVHEGNVLRGLTKSCGCLSADRRRGKRHHSWKGGRQIDGNGYVRIYNPDHRNAYSNGYVLEHILVMSRHLGRPLNTPTENVHHKNGVKTDNQLNNLELWTTSHPAGQRVEDQIKWCKKFLRTYAPQLLRSC